MKINYNSPNQLQQPADYTVRAMFKYYYYYKCIYIYVLIIYVASTDVADEFNNSRKLHAFASSKAIIPKRRAVCIISYSNVTRISIDRYSSANGGELRVYTPQDYTRNYIVYHNYRVWTA